MKNKKLFLDLEEEREMSIAVVRLKKSDPYHELFFKINQQNSFNFYRKKDLLTEDFYGYYNFPIFEAFDESTQTTFRIIANLSCDFKGKTNPANGLFDLMPEEKYFLNKNIDLIIFSRENWEDFSIVKFPEENINSIEEYSLSTEDELYQTILNYE